MKRSRKKTNYFNQPILSESMGNETLEEEYRVSQKRIEPGWLEDVGAQDYRAYVQSAFELTELKEKYENMKERSESPADMFQMAEVKFQIDHFQLRKPKTSMQSTVRSYPERFQLVLQKYGDFWGSAYQRNCVLDGYNLTVTSQKQKDSKIIDSSQYQYIYEQKKLSVGHHQASKKFQWIGSYPARIFLYHSERRLYCLYGNINDLQIIMKKIQISSTSKRNSEVLKDQKKQFQQKIITYFGIQLRKYETHMKERKRIHELEQSEILKERFKQKSAQKQQQGGQKQTPLSKVVEEVSDQNQSSSLLKNQKKIGEPQSPLRKSTISSESMFKLRCRRSVINYDELQKENQIFQVPEYKISDINLKIKEVAYSDEELAESLQQQSQPIKYMVQDSESFSIPKEKTEKFPSQRYFIQQIQSQRKSNHTSKKVESTHSKLENKYNFIEQNKEMNLYIDYFQQFYPYSTNQLHFSLLQLVDPPYETQKNQKSICLQQKYSFQRQNKHSSYFRPKDKTSCRISSRNQQFCFVLFDQVRQYDYEFKIKKLNSIQYMIDQSVFIYIKNNNNSFKCVGKLRIIISPESIEKQSVEQKSTISFLNQYLWANKQDYKKKYEFINFKRQNYEVRRKWNEKVLKKIINLAGKNKNESQQFQKAIFLGLPQNIYSKILKIVKKDEKNLQEMNLRAEQITSLISSLMSLKVADVRIYISLEQLINMVLRMEKNPQLSQRLQQVTVFHLYKYGSNSVKILLQAFIRRILLKLEPLLLRAMNEREISVIIEEYCFMEYEIDELFAAIYSDIN